MSNLKRIRESNNLSQSALAELSGVNVRTLQDYEQGQRDINKAQAINLYKIANSLKCSIEELLDK